MLGHWSWAEETWSLTPRTHACNAYAHLRLWSFPKQGIKNQLIFYYSFLGVGLKLLNEYYKFTISVLTQGVHPPLLLTQTKITHSHTDSYTAGCKIEMMMMGHGGDLTDSTERTESQSRMGWP